MTDICQAMGCGLQITRGMTLCPLHRSRLPSTLLEVIDQQHPGVPLTAWVLATLASDKDSSTPDTPEPSGWFVRLRVEGVYFGPHGAMHDGGPEGQGWATEAEALEVRDRLVVEYLGRGPGTEVNVGVGRWPVESYTVTQWYDGERIT